MLITFALPSVNLRACLLILTLSLVHVPCMAIEAAPVTKIEAKAEVNQIAFNDAPKYIQEQIRNVVLNCTEGTLTPDKARIFEYAVADKLTHYVYDYTAWAQHPLPPNCQNSPILCSQSGCLMSVYTQVKPNVFKQSLRTYVLGVGAKEVPQRQADGSVVVTPGFEMVQNKFSCRLINGGTENCTLNFTWKDNKFTYFGFGAKDDQPAIEPPHEREAPAEEPAE